MHITLHKYDMDSISAWFCITSCCLISAISHCQMRTPEEMSYRRYSYILHTSSKQTEKWVSIVLYGFLPADSQLVWCTFRCKSATVTG